MTLPALDIQVAIQLVGLIVTLTGGYYVLKLGQAQLKKDFDSLREENRKEIASLRAEISSDQTESQRLLLALHKRFDNAEQRVSRIEINHAVLEERVSNLKDTPFRETGRFKLSEKQQVPMFLDKESED